MSDQATPTRFPAMRTAAAIILAAALLTPASWFVAGVVGDKAQAMGATLFALVLVGGLALLSLVPVAILERRGVMATVVAWFAAMLVRLPACLIAAAVAVRCGTFDGPTLAVTLGVFYVPLLLVEAGLVGRHLWHKDDAQGEPPSAAELTA